MLIKDFLVVIAVLFILPVSFDETENFRKWYWIVGYMVH